MPSLGSPAPLLGGGGSRIPVLLGQLLESGAWSGVGTVGRQMLDLFFAFQAVCGEGPDIQCRPAVGPPSWVGRGRAGEEGWVEGSYQGPPAGKGSRHVGLSQWGEGWRVLTACGLSLPAHGSAGGLGQRQV